MNATGATITQNSTAFTTITVSYTGSSAINLGGNITISGGTIALTGPVTLNANVTADTTNAGGNPAGGSITFSSSIDGANSLACVGGTSGTVSFGTIGGNTPLTSLSATSKFITQTSTATTSGALSYTGTSSISLGGNITTNGANINLTGPVTLTNAVTADATNAGAVSSGANIAFSSTINGANILTLTGGTSGNVSFGTIGGTTPLSLLTVSGSSVTQNSTVQSTGALSYTGISAINLNGNITTSGGAITLTGPVNIKFQYRC